MKNRNIPRTLFIVILLIFLVNAISSVAKAIEDGASFIPAVCWSIASIIWIARARLGEEIRDK
jgi:hypothetical protein